MESTISGEELSALRERGQPITIPGRLAGRVSFGDVVVTGYHHAPDNLSYLGRVVQIRVGWGAFGSDLVLIRHPDEALRAHENQCFWKLCEEDARTLLQRYYPPDLLALDNDTIEYFAGGIGKTGFVVRDPRGPVAWATAVGVSVEPGKQNGVQR
ncbi:MAG: hypothetical protein WC343_11055 [Bacilli bacterium]|jgi:hypothetical protein